VAQLTANLIARISYLDTASLNQKLTFISKTPRHYQFFSEVYQPLVVPSGISSTTQILTGITGHIDSLMFVIRPTTGLTSTAQYNFTEITSWNLLNSGGQSMVGGQPITSRISNLVLNKWWSNSSFSQEGYAGLNNSFVYIWSFSTDNVRSRHSGENLGHETFRGNEQLVINFASTLAASVQIDVFAASLSALEQRLTSITKSFV
jgi:hypothetical protein